MALERRDLERALRRFVGNLPETERRVFLARYWYLAPVQEIAEKLGFSQSKTASMLHRARKKLQRMLQEEGLCE
jgi:RNA polymerase sigma-70 factor (ECF subfamily)